MFLRGLQLSITSGISRICLISPRIPTWTSENAIDSSVQVCESLSERPRTRHYIGFTIPRSFRQSRFETFPFPKRPFTVSDSDLIEVWPSNSSSSKTTETSVIPPVLLDYSLENARSTLSGTTVLPPSYYHSRVSVCRA